MKKKIFIILIVLAIIIVLINGKNINLKKIETKLLNNYNTYQKEEYYGYLIIPSININLGFYNYDNPLNDVSKNIELIKIPVKNSYLFAAHSGIGKIAYFNDLDKLKENDIIYLKFKDKSIKYKVTKVVRVKKNGSIEITNEENKIYLTTCDQIIEGYQLVVEGTILN